MKRCAVWPASTLDAVGLEARTHQVGHFDILAHQDARQHLDLRDLAAEASERLRQFASDRSTAEHDQATRQFTQVPDRVGSQVADFGESGIGGTNGRLPAAITMLFVVSVRGPDAVRTSTVHGVVMRAVPAMHSTPSAL